MFTPILDLEVLTKATVLRFTDVTGPDVGTNTKWDGVGGISSIAVTAAEILVTDPEGSTTTLDVTATINASWPVTDDIVFPDITGEWIDGFYTAVYNVHMVAVNIAAFDDYGGGRVKVTAMAHNTLTGMRVTIDGTTNHDGTYDATFINANEYYITAVYIAEAGGIGKTTTPYYSNSFSPFVFSNVEMAIDRMLAVFCNMDESSEGDDYMKQIIFLNGLLWALRSAITTTTVARINNIYGRITRILDFNNIELTYT
jgi:hypothetical protein